MTALVGCGSDSESDDTSAVTTSPASTDSPVVSTSTPPAATQTPTKSLTEIEATVQVFVDGLDALNIDHTAPVRKPVQMSGAKAAFELKVNGYDAGINIFPNSDALETWQEASDSFGGIHVEYGLGALSLNSSEGVSNSAEIAPKLAEQIGGTAHGV